MKNPVLLSGKDHFGHQTHKLHGPVIQAGEDRLLLVDLGRRLAVDDEEIVAISQTFIDLSGSFVPFLGQTCSKECKEISLRVELPFKADGTVFYNVFTHASERPAKREPLTGTRQGVRWVYERRVQDPTHGNNYRIVWKKEIP